MNCVSKNVRTAFLSSLIATTAAVIALTGWLLWPEWQRYSALRRLEEAGRARDSERFLDAVEAIGRLPADERLVSDLVERAKDRDPGVRAYSILTLPVLQPRPVCVVSLLIATLDNLDEDDSVRAAAAAGLWSFGRQAQGAVSCLLRNEFDSTGNLRWATSSLLYSMETWGPTRAYKGTDWVDSALPDLEKPPREQAEGLLLISDENRFLQEFRRVLWK